MLSAYWLAVSLRLYRSKHQPNADDKLMYRNSDKRTFPAESVENAVSNLRMGFGNIQLENR